MDRYDKFRELLGRLLEKSKGHAARWQRGPREAEFELEFEEGLLIGLAKVGQDRYRAHLVSGQEDEVELEASAGEADHNLLAALHREAVQANQRWEHDAEMIDRALAEEETVGREPSEHVVRAPSQEDLADGDSPFEEERQRRDD